MKTKITTFLNVAANVLILAGVQANSSFAQNAAPAAAPIFVNPVALMQEVNFPPKMGDEGVITARFTVKADGSTSDIEILGGFTNPVYDKAIKDSVAKWTFTPGTVNGDIKDFFNQEYTFTRRASENLAVSTAVQQHVDEVSTLLNAADYSGAKKVIQAALAKDVHSVFDYALMNEFLATAETGLEDPFAALQAIKQATQSTISMTGTREYMLPPELLEKALRQRLGLEAAVRQHAEVLRTWGELKALYNVAAADPVNKWVATAQEAINSPDQLLQLGKITADKQWSQQLSRRIFSIADVREGTLKKVVAHCERRTLELEYKEGVDWNLPAAIGECKIEFQGDIGTLFSVYEFVQ